MKNIMVLFGGMSSEHEVSCRSAVNVLFEIDSGKYNVIPVYIGKDGCWRVIKDMSMLKKVCDFSELSESGSGGMLSEMSPGGFILSLASRAGYDRVDVIHPVLHGINGEDGRMQGFLDMTGIPYVGAGVLSSAMGMDKEISKIMFSKAGIRVGRYISVLRENIVSDSETVFKYVEKEILYPCFVKPANAGSSVGVCKVNDSRDLLTAIENAAVYDRKILIEQFIDAKECECAVIGNSEPQASGVGEIITCNEFYDYNAKYIDDGSICVIPADIPNETAETIRRYSILAYRSIMCEGLARVDFLVERLTGDVYINEINTLPGFTDISMFPALWQNCGLTYKMLLDKLYGLAEKSHTLNRRQTVYG